MVSLGKTQAPFGTTVDIEGKDLNELLNSAKYAFILTKDIKETDYLLMSVLAEVIPICNINHTYIKKLGLKNFATLPDEHNVLDLLTKMKICNKIYTYRISLKSWQFRNQWKKWNK